MSWWVVRNASGTSAVSEPTQADAQATGSVLSGPYATQAQAQSAISSGGSMATGSGGGCGPQAIYNELLTQGFSTVQAIGAMANAIAESTLQPETAVMDTNGAMSYGLWQFNAASYGDASKLVTGNCANDIVQQVGYLKSHVSGSALNGTTGAEVAGNFAANFERCQGCQAGDTSTPNGWGTRVGHAATVEGWITSGKWPTSSTGISGSSGGGSSAASATLTSSPCVISLPLVGCLLNPGQARGALGGLLMIAGGLVVLPGLIVLAAAGFAAAPTGAASAAVSATEKLPGYGQAIRAARSTQRARGAAKTASPAA